MNWTSLTPLGYFASLVADDRSFPLTEAAAAIADDDGDSVPHDVQGVLDTIDALGARLKDCLPADASPLVRLRALQRYFFQELGFVGREGFSPADHHLHEVLLTRVGSPVALTVIYLELASQIGLHAECVTLPGQFLIRLSLPLGDVILDPVDGRSLSREALLDRLERRGTRTVTALPYPDAGLETLLCVMPARDVLAQLLRGLEAAHRSAGDRSRLLAAQQRLVVLLPEEHDWRRDRGLTLALLGRTEEAIGDLSDYLSRTGPYAPDRHQIAARLRALRSAVRARWH